jgi:hypothetical protein
MRLETLSAEVRLCGCRRGETEHRRGQNDGRFPRPDHLETPQPAPESCRRSDDFKRLSDHFESQAWPSPRAPPPWIQVCKPLFAPILNDPT